MGLTNREENEINFCKFQIKWREQELIVLEAEFKNKEWLSEGDILNEKKLWEATQKIGKLKREVVDFNKRLIQIQTNA